jgi:ribosomal protein S28E/S33
MTATNQSDSSVSPTLLTSTQAVNWEKVVVVDVLSFKTGNVGEKEFIKLHNCEQRMKGRAVGRICGPIKVQLYSSPGHVVKAAICGVPQKDSNPNAPANVSNILACRGIVLSSGSLTGTDTGTLSFLPGVALVLKGETTSILSGSPPHLYAIGSAVDLKGTAATGVDIEISLEYELEISGWDWIKPF